MNADTTQFQSPEAHDDQHTRRAKVAPLLAAGMSVLCARDELAYGT